MNSSKSESTSSATSSKRSRISSATSLKLGGDGSDEGGMVGGGDVDGGEVLGGIVGGGDVVEVVGGGMVGGGVVVDGNGGMVNVGTVNVGTGGTWAELLPVSNAAVAYATPAATSPPRISLRRTAHPRESRPCSSSSPPVMGQEVSRQG